MNLARATPAFSDPAMRAAAASRSIFLIIVKEPVSSRLEGSGATRLPLNVEHRAKRLLAERVVLPYRKLRVSGQSQTGRCLAVCC